MKCLICTVCLILVLAASASTVNAELAAHWTFDEGSGATAYDSAGTNNGVLQQGAGWTAGVINGGLNLDGVNDYVDVPDNLSLRFSQTNSFTIAFWAKPTTGGYVLSKMRTAGSGVFGYELSYSGGSTQAFNFGVESSWRGQTWINTGINSAPAGTWNFVTAVYNNKSMQIYLNGVLKSSGTFAYDAYNGAPSKNLAIGTRSYDNTRESYFGGSLDDLLIYNEALSADQVLQLYASYNDAPIANAGDDQCVYAGLDGMATVTLDGSGSSDPENDILTYTWSYTVDEQVYEANGVNPTLNLPAGMYAITLIVSDGVNDSEADNVSVEIVAPLKVDMKLSALHWQRHKYLDALFLFPPELNEQLDPYSVVIFANAPIIADSFDLVVNKGDIVRFNVSFAVENLSQLAIRPGQTITIFGMFRSGRIFYGTVKNLSHFFS